MYTIERSLASVTRVPCQPPPEIHMDPDLGDCLPHLAVYLPLKYLYKAFTSMFKSHVKSALMVSKAGTTGFRPVLPVLVLVHLPVTLTPTSYPGAYYSLLAPV